MNLSIDTLKEMGAFAPVDLTEKEIEWQQDGETLSATVYVRAMSYQTAVAEISASHNGGNALAARIAECICHRDGSPVFTADDITGDADPENRGPMCSALTYALLGVIQSVSGLGKSKRRSATKRRSGTNSSSTVSAVEPSKKPSAD